MFKIKKFFAIVAFCLVSFPALATLAGNIGIALAGAGTVGLLFALTTSGAIVPLVSAQLLVMGYSLVISDNGSLPSSEAGADIVINLDPNKPLITPAGWTSPTSPPATTTSTTKYYMPNWADGLRYLSAADSCAASIGKTFSGYPVYAATLSSPTICAIQYRQVNPLTYNAAVSSELTCPAGYTLSGSACNLTTPTAVIKPISNRQEVKRVGDTFVADTQANPADVHPPSQVTVTPKAVTVNAMDGSKTVTTINNDNSISIVNYSPVAGSNNSTKTTTNLSAPTATAAPHVTGRIQEIVTGQGDAVTNTAAAAPAIDISSLNKEATQAQIQSNTASIKDDVKKLADGYANSGVSDFGNQNSMAFDGASIDNAIGRDDARSQTLMSSLTSKLGIPSGGQCGNAHISASLFSTAFNADFSDMCSTFAPLINYLFWVLTIMFVWGEVVEARLS